MPEKQETHISQREKSKAIANQPEFEQSLSPQLSTLAPPPLQLKVSSGKESEQQKENEKSEVAEYKLPIAANAEDPSENNLSKSTQKNLPPYQLKKTVAQPVVQMTDDEDQQEDNWWSRGTRELQQAWVYVRDRVSRFFARPPSAEELEDPNVRREYSQRVRSMGGAVSGRGRNAGPQSQVGGVLGGMADEQRERRVEGIDSATGTQ